MWINSYLFLCMRYLYLFQKNIFKILFKNLKCTNKIMYANAEEYGSFNRLAFLLNICYFNDLYFDEKNKVKFSVSINFQSIIYRIKCLSLLYVVKSYLLWRRRKVLPRLIITLQYLHTSPGLSYSLHQVAQSRYLVTGDDIAVMTSYTPSFVINQHQVHTLGGLRVMKKSKNICLTWV